MGRQEPSKDEVLAWMVAEKKGPSAAAEHFKIPMERVKVWRRRSGLPPTAKPGTGQGPKDGVRRPGARRISGDSIALVTRDHARASALGSDVIEDLRHTVAGTTKYLRHQAELAASGEEVNMRNFADAARALDALLGRASDLLTFDDRTKGTNSSTSDVGARTKRLADALGVQPTAPILKVLRGNMVEES